MKLEHFASFPDKFQADVIAELLQRAGIEVETITAMDSENLRSSRVCLFVNEDELVLAGDMLHEVKKPRSHESLLTLQKHFNHLLKPILGPAKN